MTTPRLKKTFTLLFTTTLLTAVFVWLTIPRSSLLRLPAITTLNETQFFIAPESGTIKKLISNKSDSVNKKDLILSIQKPELSAEIELAKYSIKQLEHQLLTAESAHSKVHKAALLKKKEELIKAKFSLTGLRKELKALELRAEINGVILEWDDSLSSDMTIEKGTPIGRMGNLRSLQITAYIHEEDALNLSPKQDVYFYDSSTYKKHKAFITRISVVRTERIIHASLTSQEKGDIAVIPTRTGSLQPVDSYYEVSAKLKNYTPESLRIGQRGYLLFKTSPKSYLLSRLSYLNKILLRESSL